MKNDLITGAKASQIDELEGPTLTTNMKRMKTRHDGLGKKTFHISKNDTKNTKLPPTVRHQRIAISDGDGLPIFVNIGAQVHHRERKDELVSTAISTFNRKRAL